MIFVDKYNHTIIIFLWCGEKNIIQTLGVGKKHYPYRLSAFKHIHTRHNKFQHSPLL